MALSLSTFRQKAGSVIMCGIAGIVSMGIRTSPELLDALVEGVSHRGPDDRGIYYSPDGRCALGHTRLAILDLSATGHQPMLDDDTGNAIVFNGEIYNFASLRKDCEAHGYRFRSHSDTEVILALYRKHGTDCLRFLRGMFAFAIWDVQRQRLFFARDRVGKKPFHYALTPEGFSFCSEIDPLARHPWTDCQLDYQALDFFLHLGYIPAPHSIYRGIRKLPPAHFGILDGDGLRLERYWRINYNDKIHMREADALDAFEEMLGESVKLRMVADVPVGALLSGGVDSSLVVAMMAKFSAEPVRTFSIGFTESDCDESAYAQQAAEICGTLHRPHELGAPNVNLLPMLVRRYGEPYGDSSSLPSFAVCATAQQELKVVLNGDGGDELLGGYPRYSLTTATIQMATWIRRHRPLAIIDPGRRPGSRSFFPFKKISRLALMHLLQPDAGPLTMYSSCHDDAARSALLGDCGLEENLSQWRTDWFREARLSTDNPVDTMLWLDNHIYLPDDLLVKMDIASMHCGLESRSPLLDHKLIEFCARLPVGLKVKHSAGKYLLKKLAERYYPREFVHRRKMGFGIPLVKWLHGPLRSLLDDVLRDPACMSPLDQVTVDHYRRRFIEHNADEAARVWLLLMYGLWRRHGAPATL